jgi:hypothetical protein
VNDGVITQLMTERIERDAPTTVDRASLDAWCEFFGEDRTRHRTTTDGWVVPPAMTAVFGRPVVAPIDGSTQLGLHDRLKEQLGLPIGIAVGYELECHALLHDGDRLSSVERIASVGDLRDTKFGPGRDWVVEVVSANGAGDLVGIERWSMLGYDPSQFVRSTQAHSTTALIDDEPSQWSASVEVTRDFVVEGATVDRVWAAGHHDDVAAKAAGLPGIILDTSTWVSLAATHGARWIGGDPRPGRVSLSMTRPVSVDDVVDLAGYLVGDVVDERGVRWVSVEIVGRVRGRVATGALVRFAVATADGADVWTLRSDRWLP